MRSFKLDNSNQTNKQNQLAAALLIIGLLVALLLDMYVGGILLLAGVGVWLAKAVA